MADRWLRWYEGSIRDGKFRIVAENVEETVATVIGVWAALLEDASVSVPRGTVTKSLSWHATYLQIGEERIGTIWNELERLDVIKRINESISIINWNKRQFESDHLDPTAKQRKHKWKQKVSKPDRSKAFHGTAENDLERSGTPETETETETETDKKERSCSNEFERFWKAYPRRVGKKAAEKALAKALKETSTDTIIEALARQTPLWTDPKFIPHPATWLNAGRWADDVGYVNGAPKRTYSPEEIEAGRAWYLRKQAEAAE